MSHDDRHDRLRQRLSDEMDPHQLRTLLRAMPQPGPEAAARVHRRLNAPVPSQASAWRWIAAGGVGLAGLALAAGWLLAPAPVQVQQIAWDDGQTEVDGPMELTTRELHATGSALATVERSALGTLLTVHRGELAVDCLADTDATLLSGQSLRCRPVTGEASLARLRQLDAEQRPVAELEAERQRALTLPTDPPAAAELTRLEHVYLLRQRDETAALASARAWLDAGHSLRRNEVQRTAASLALQLEGCDGALPHLDALASTDPEAAHAAATCRQGGTR